MRYLVSAVFFLHLVLLIKPVAISQTISFSSESLLAISSSNCISVFGDAKKHMPIELKDSSLRFKKVQMSISGNGISENFLALTENGRLYCWGTNQAMNEKLNMEFVWDFAIGPYGSVLINPKAGPFRFYNFHKKEAHAVRIRDELNEIEPFDVSEFSMGAAGIGILMYSGELIRIPLSEEGSRFVPPEVQYNIVNFNSGWSGKFYATLVSGQMVYWDEQLHDAHFLDECDGCFGLNKELNALDVEEEIFTDIWIHTRNGGVQRLNGWKSRGDRNPYSLNNYNPFEHNRDIALVVTGGATGGMFVLTDYGKVYFSANGNDKFPKWVKEFTKKQLEAPFLKIDGITPGKEFWEIFNLDILIPIERSKNSRRIYSMILKASQGDEQIPPEKQFFSALRSNANTLVYISKVCSRLGERINPYQLAKLIGFSGTQDDIDEAIDSYIESWNAKLAAITNATLITNDSIKFNGFDRVTSIDRIFVVAIEGQDCLDNIHDGQDIALLAESLLLGEYEILERRYFEQILEEQRLSASGLLNEKTAVELGLNAGSQGILFTEVGCLDGIRTINLKLVDCQTSEIYWSCIGIGTTPLETVQKVKEELSK